MRTALRLLLGGAFSLCAMVAQAAEPAAGGALPSSLQVSEQSTAVLRFVGVLREVANPIPVDEPENLSRLVNGASAPATAHRYTLLLDTPDGVSQLIQDRYVHQTGTPVVSSAGIAINPITKSEGYILQVTTGLLNSRATGVELTLQHFLPEPTGTSQIEISGSKSMSVGSWQVLNWQHAGKQYALLLQLESATPL
ncbi:hypothetical protein [Stutzerimonas stutzeri]|uniref:hypothetical protein n=1 Tax=Stutzerimonas stutzeri TaxID=316 RepID=UPI0015E2DC3F|nr:hypothetical protein [Stutzerimonas stutzeri]MBA1280307.1 hypothetical protein [Stutzerimonas stutzeri]